MEADLHYGAFSVTHVGRQLVILDWSMQTDPGNPELVRRAGLATAKPKRIGGSRTLRKQDRSAKLR